MEAKFGCEIFKLVMDEDHYVNIVNTSIQWKEMVEKYGANINDLVSDLSLIKEHKEHYM